MKYRIQLCRHTNRTEYTAITVEAADKQSAEAIAYDYATEQQDFLDWERDDLLHDDANELTIDSVQQVANDEFAINEDEDETLATDD
jgi:predicted Zn-dependent peptidase